MENLRGRYRIDPSPYSASSIITNSFSAHVMEVLHQVVNERVSFLNEQIKPQNKPLVNQAFEIQIETLRNAARN